MVKAKLEKKLENKIKQDPVSVMIIILVFTVLTLGVLVFMHISQEQEIDQLRSDLKQEVLLREVR